MNTERARIMTMTVRSSFANSSIRFANSFSKMLILMSCLGYFIFGSVTILSVGAVPAVRRKNIGATATNTYYASAGSSVIHPTKREDYANDYSYGFSPNLEASYHQGNSPEESEFYSKSFYERNGLVTPPLISRRPKVEEERRAQEGEEPVNSDLEEIIFSAKEGTDYATLLRQDLLFNNGLNGNSYDRHAFPWEYAWYNKTVKTGLPIEFNINFHRVFSVDVVNPVLDMIVWLRQEWVDPRLTWKPEEYGNMTTIWFWIGDGGAGGETSEIWTPDIELWNLDEDIGTSTTDTYAIVSNDGSIFWSRPGHLRPACKFTGLVMFPFDRLTCTMEFGSWVYSGKYLRLVKGQNTGFSMGGSQTAGESYSEFKFAEEDPVTCDTHVYPPYPAAPEEDWPVLMYNVTVVRSWQPYARGFLVLQVIFNIIGFAAFWLPPSCGERMGLSITAMLASVAAEISIAGKLPSFQEYSWFQKFNIYSMVFAFVSLLECVLVLYFFYKRTETTTPGWYSDLKRFSVVRKAEKHATKTIARSKELMKESGNKFGGKAKQDVEEIKAETVSPGDQLELDKYSSRDSFFENDRKKTVSQDRTSRKATSLHNFIHNAGDVLLEDSDTEVHCTRDELRLSQTQMVGLTDSDMEDSKDMPLNGLEAEESRMSETRNPKKVSFDTKEEEEWSKTEVDGGVPSLLNKSRREMMQELKHMYSNQSITITPRDADDFNNEEEVILNRQWKLVAARIDSVARFWIPVVYFIGLAIILGQVEK